MSSSDTVGDPSIDNIPEARSITKKIILSVQQREEKRQLLLLLSPLKSHDLQDIEL